MELSGISFESANIKNTAKTVELCKAVGIDHVTVCDPFDVKAFEKVVKNFNK